MFAFVTMSAAFRANEMDYSNDTFGLKNFATSVGAKHGDAANILASFQNNNKNIDQQKLFQQPQSSLKNSLAQSHGSNALKQMFTKKMDPMEVLTKVLSFVQEVKSINSDNFTDILAQQFEKLRPVVLSVSDSIGPLSTSALKDLIATYQDIATDLELPAMDTRNNVPHTLTIYDQMQQFGQLEHGVKDSLNNDTEQFKKFQQRCIDHIELLKKVIATTELSNAFPEILKSIANSDSHFVKTMKNVVAMHQQGGQNLTMFLRR